MLDHTIDQALCFMIYFHCKTILVATPGDSRLIAKVNEKNTDLKIELQRMRNVRVIIVPLIIGCLRLVSTSLVKYLDLPRNIGTRATEKCPAKFLPHFKVVCYWKYLKLYSFIAIFISHFLHDALLNNNNNNNDNFTKNYINFKALVEHFYYVLFTCSFLFFYPLFLFRIRIYCVHCMYVFILRKHAIIIIISSYRTSSTQKMPKTSFHKVM